MRPRTFLILFIILQINTIFFINNTTSTANHVDKCSGLLYASDKSKESIVCFDNMLQQDPKNATLWIEKSKAFTYIGDLFNDKGDRFKQGENAELFPWNNTKCGDADICYENARQFYNESVNFAEKAIELDPQNVFAFFSKGSGLYMLGKYEDAIHCSDKCIEMISQSSDVSGVFQSNVWALKGRALYKLGNYEDAIYCFDNAIKKVESSSEFGSNLNEASAYKWKSNCLEKIGRNEEADAALARSKKLRGNYAPSIIISPGPLENSKSNLT